MQHWEKFSCTPVLGTECCRVIPNVTWNWQNYKNYFRYWSGIITSYSYVCILFPAFFVGDVETLHYYQEMLLLPAWCCSWLTSPSCYCSNTLSNLYPAQVVYLNFSQYTEAGFYKGKSSFCSFCFSLFQIYSRLDFLTSLQEKSLSLRRHLVVIAAYRFDDLRSSEMKWFVSVLLCWSSWELAMNKGHVVVAATGTFLSRLANS